MRGSGAWRLKDYARSSNYEYVKNPDWYDADKVKLEGKKYAILPERRRQHGAVPHRQPLDLPGAAGRGHWH